MKPRVSRHTIVASHFVPFRYLSQAYDGFSVLPFQAGADLIHAHNKIPLGARKMICSFESHMPRRFGLQDRSMVLKTMQKEIESDRCRRLIGMSHYARRQFEFQHQESKAWKQLESKLMVRHPNATSGAYSDKLAGDSCEQLVLTFIGGHFGRKGGCVSVRIADLAMRRGLPVQVNIVSALQAGKSVWTDPTQSGFFDPYLHLLELPNVRHFHSLPNEAVRDLMGQSHFSLLPTFADTFGFSAIESMSEFTPVIGTRCCALPEFIETGINGYLFDLETDALGSWVNPGYARRGDDLYARTYREAVERLAEQITDELEKLVGEPKTIGKLRANARLTAQAMFDADTAATAWDDLYEHIAAENTSVAAERDPNLDFSSPENAKHVFISQSAVAE